MARNRKTPQEDPIMWEVDDDTGNDPVPAKGKKKDKSASLMRKVKQSEGNGAASKVDARKQKEAMRREYGDLDSDSDDDDDDDFTGDPGAASARRGRMKKEKGYFGSVKWSHVAVLMMMMGGAIAPMIMILGDKLGPLISSAVTVVVPDFNPMLVRMGIAKTPKKRLTAFYEKHNPEKMEDVDKILLKYAGDYKTMTKKLESKYHDYGFFMGWEAEGGLVDAQKKTQAFIKKHGLRFYKKYVPYPVRLACNNLYNNAMYAYNYIAKGLDDLTNPDAAPGAQKKKRSKTGKSRRARNSESRD